MFTSSFSQYNSSTTDSLRRWGSQITSGCIYAGLIDTNPVGRILWSEVTRSATANAYYGYDVFRFDDALQSTHPIFIKIDYYNRSNVTPRIDVVVGTTHNGSGTVGGISRTMVLQHTTDASQSADRSLMFSAGDGWFNMLLWYDNPVYSRGFFIERTRDYNGDITSQGVMVNTICSSNSTGRPSQFYMPFSGNLPPTESMWGVYYGPRGIYHPTEHLGRIFHYDGMVLPIPLTNILLFSWHMSAPFKIFSFQPFTNKPPAKYISLSSGSALTTGGREENTSLASHPSIILALRLE
jgi:hypothetical protein